jgi:hypothetical protein
LIEQLANNRTGEITYACNANFLPPDLFEYIIENNPKKCGALYALIDSIASEIQNVKAF